MQIELTVSELAKRTNRTLLSAIYFNLSSPCTHAIFSNFYKAPCREVPAVPRRASGELPHPSVTGSRARGSSRSHTHGPCSLRRAGVRQRLLRGSLRQPGNAVTATRLTRGIKLHSSESYQAGLFSAAPGARGIAPPHSHTESRSMHLLITKLI